jgi:3-carboxymuconate cyclase
MKKILFCITGIVFLMLTSCVQESKEMYLFVGSYAKASDSGITLYRFNPADGSTTLVREVSNIANPTYLTLSKDEKFLYSVSETDVPNANVSVYSFDNNKNDVDIRFLYKKETKGASPCHIWVNDNRTLAVTANYMGGSISVFPLAANGMLDEPSLFIFEEGASGVGRQDASHLHFTYSSPDGKYLFANDLGADRIYKFDIIDEKDGNATLKEGQPAYFTMPEGKGPRHTTFHPNGMFAYVIGELSGNVTVLQYNESNFNVIQSIESDPHHNAGSADIHITPDGRFLYASNRGKGDGLAIFSINKESGKLTNIGYQPTESHPRNFIITPDGKHLLCACRDGNVIQVFTIDKENGLLKNINKDIKVSKPVCLKFAST